jgi:hypothetical protein
VKRPVRFAADSAPQGAESGLTREVAEQGCERVPSGLCSPERLLLAVTARRRLMAKGRTTAMFFVPSE